MNADRILGEFVDAWNAGRRPNVDAYLARASPGERDELASQLMMWLEIAPTPRYDKATRKRITQEPALGAALRAAAAARASLADQLPSLRARAGLTVAELGQRVTDAFGLSDADRATRYLRRVESGELDPRGLSRRLLEVLGRILGADLSLATTAGRVTARPVAARSALWRADEEAERGLAADLELLSRAALTPAPEPLGELDRLFRGGPDG